MGFILKTDLYSIATNDDLNVLSDSNDKIIEQCNRIAIDEAKGYLSQKYNVQSIFLQPVEFNQNTPYNIGDRIYVTDTATTEVTHYSCIATGNTEYTGTTTGGTDYTGATIDNILYFEEGDTRDNKLLEVVMSMSLFYLHKRLSPNNIPAFRIVAYDGNGNENIMSSIKWLLQVQSGLINPYNWLLLADDPSIEDPDITPPSNILGNDPSVGLMWGNESIAGMNDYFYHFNQIPDPNIIANYYPIITSTTETTI